MKFEGADVVVIGGEKVVVDVDDVVVLVVFVLVTITLNLFVSVIDSDISGSVVVSWTIVVVKFSVSLDTINNPYSIRNIKITSDFISGRFLKLASTFLRY
jgi:hypothetical protein